MRPVSQGEIIRSGIQNVAALRAGGIVRRTVPACHVLHVGLDGHGFGRAGFEHVGLRAIQELYAGFLNAVFLVIAGVRGGNVQLHHVLASHVAGVFNGHFGGDGLIF